MLLLLAGTLLMLLLLLLGEFLPPILLPTGVAIGAGSGCMLLPTRLLFVGAGCGCQFPLLLMLLCEVLIRYRLREGQPIERLAAVVVSGRQQRSTGVTPPHAFAAEGC